MMTKMKYYGPDKRIRKRGLLTLIQGAFLFMLSIIFFPVSAEATEYGIWIGNVQITSDNLVIDSEDNSSFSGKAEYVPAKFTLTLTNFDNGGSTGTFTTYGDTFTCGLYSNRPVLYISLSGTSNISNNSDSSIQEKYGLLCEGDECVVHITGNSNNDSLTLKSGDSTASRATCAGLYVMGNLYFDSGTVISKGGNATLRSYGAGVFYGGTLNYGYLAIIGGTLKAEAANATDSYGVYVTKDITIKEDGQLASVGKKQAVSGLVKNSIAGIGWTDINGTQEKQTITANTAGQSTRSYKKVMFPVPTYSVTVNNGTGKGYYPEDQVVTIVADAPAEGKVFEKWISSDGVVFTDANSTTTTFTMPARDVSVTAFYKDIESDSVKCTVSFDANGGSGSMAKVAVDKDASYTLPACSFTAPAGKEFEKWDKGSVGASITVTEDIVIKAQWKETKSPADDEKIDNTLKNTSIISLKPGKKALTVKWKKVKAKDIKGYEIQYSTDKKFKKDVKKVAINKVKTTSKKIKKLKSKKKYFVRIRTFKKTEDGNAYSKWSKVKSAKVK